MLSLQIMTYHVTAKVIKSLSQKKYREQTKKFLVEGEKGVAELLKSDFKIDFVYATRDFAKKYAKELARPNLKIQQVEASELRTLGAFESNSAALAVAFQKEPASPKILPGITLALDGISDPGNLGTIIRTADWYGIKSVICSKNCVDFYNPKVISATMGSFARVSVCYADLPDFLAKAGVPAIGAVLGGASAHAFRFPASGILVIGSESHGISPEVRKTLKGTVSIPRFGGAESLNAGIATGVILDRWISGLEQK